MLSVLSGDRRASLPSLHPDGLLRRAVGEQLACGTDTAEAAAAS